MKAVILYGSDSPMDSATVYRTMRRGRGVSAISMVQRHLIIFTTAALLFTVQICHSTPVTSGQLFTTDVKRPAPLWMSEWSLPESAKSTFDCSVPLAAVVTTLKSRLPSVRQFLALFNTSMVIVVLDASSQMYEDVDSRIHVLSLENQTHTSPLSETIPLNSFARKNLGYIFAAKLGACAIWDFDDDNYAFDIELLHRTEHETGKGRFMLTTSSGVVNPYVLFGPEKYVWPRGYPIELTQNQTYPTIVSLKSGTISATIDVVQVLQTRDPDVDAIWRLQNSLPLEWHTAASLKNELVSIQPGCFSPFNAQSTLVHRKAFWSMYLPHSVHGRVSDIWRSYVAQAIFP